MLTVLFKLLGSRLGQFVLIGLIGLGAGVGLHKRLAQPTLTTTVVHDVKQVRVEVPVLTEKIIDRIITDPRQQEAIRAIVKENNELKLKIQSLSSTVATNTTTGGTNQSNSQPGTITPPQVVPGGTTGSDNLSTYKDYQLEATYSQRQFDYKLSQKFIIESTIGRDSSGNNTVGIVRLFQSTPKGLVVVPVETTVIQATPNPVRWWVSPRIQGGLGIDQDKAKYGIITAQIFKRGTSKDPRDLSMAIGSIGVRIGEGLVAPVVLPLSVNLGHLSRQPFSNLWLGPTIGLDKAHKLGLSLSATF